MKYVVKLSNVLTTERVIDARSEDEAIQMTYEALCDDEFNTGVYCSMVEDDNEQWADHHIKAEVVGTTDESWVDWPRADDKGADVFNARNGEKLVRDAYDLIRKGCDVSLWFEENSVNPDECFAMVINAYECFTDHWDDVIAYIKTLDGTTVNGRYECRFNEAMHDFEFAVGSLMAAWAGKEYEGIAD